jgi:hypothetical protein
MQPLDVDAMNIRIKPVRSWTNSSHQSWQSCPRKKSKQQSARLTEGELHQSAPDLHQAAKSPLVKQAFTYRSGADVVKSPDML